MYQRLLELYEIGGKNEVKRGISDFIYYRVKDPLNLLSSHVYSTAELTVNDNRVVFAIENPEDIVRSRGHGERDVLAAFDEAIYPGATVWDVGANVGTYSIVAALSGASVEAFEPGESAIHRLRRNVELNGVDIDIREYALSDENGERILSRESRSGVRRVRQSGEGDDVRVRRGDDLQFAQPDVVKIDVEGTELAVIRGMKATLSDVSTCFIEYHDNVDRRVLEAEMAKVDMSVQREFERDILQFTS